MLHLCIDVRLYNQAGIGTYLKTFLPFLTRFKLTLLVQEPLNFPAKQIIFKSSIYSWKEQLEFVKKIPHCDLFWSPHFNIPLLPIRAKKRMVTIHDVFHLAHFSTLTFLQKIYAKYVIRRALCLSDYVMTVSQFSAQEIEKYCFKPKNFAVIPNSCIVYPDKQVIKGLPKQYILYVGNLKKHKNLKRLFEAYALLNAPPPLVVVGKEFGEITLPREVYYLGKVSDDQLYTLYSSAQFLIFPSMYEGFGLPPIEAMACGCPVIVSKVASLPEVCGDAVEYIDPYSVDSIKEGMERLIGHRERREELVQKGKEHVKKYAPEKSAEKLIEVIHACCSCT